MAEAASLPAPRAPRYRTLDLWRGVACLLVVIFHSSSVAYLTAQADGTLGSGPFDLLLGLARLGWVGVPFFFVISGYAISATADTFRRQQGGGATYFKRRLRRIYPPYWAMIALQLAIVYAVDVALRPGLLTESIAPIQRGWEFSAGQWFGNLTLTESWRASVLPFRSDQAYILGQAWTLCYEEQFYLVAGLAIIARPAAYFKIAAAVTVVAMILPLVGPPARIPIAGFFVDGYWLAFAAGVLLYRQVNYGSRGTAPWAWAALAGGIGYSFLLTKGHGEIGRDLIAALLFAMLLLALHRFDGRVAGARLLRPLAFAGTICYSMYLSHAVVVRSISQAMHDAGARDAAATVLLVIPVCVAVAVVVGWAFHMAVERHFLNRGSSSSSSGFASGGPAEGSTGAPAGLARTGATGLPG